MIEKGQETQSRHWIAPVEYFQQMISEIRDYAIIVLDRHGYIQNWNTGAQLIKGYSSEVIGQHFSVFYSAEDIENSLPERLLEEAHTKGKAVHEGWRVRKDGSRFWGNIVITSLHDNGGQLIGFIKVTRDLTEKKRAEDKLRDYAAELEASNKELEQFTYITSHDLQEPLRKIRMFVEATKRSADDPKTLSAGLERIDAATKKMSALIRSLVDYTDLTRDSGKTDVDLNLIMKEVRTRLSERIKAANVALTIDRLPVVVAVRSQITQLFTNLIDNALKFSSDNPALLVTARVVDQGDVLDMPTHMMEGKYHELKFQDNGIGFDQQYCKQIFSIFQRLHTSQAFQGTGVGLALSRKIVENHKGHITARSQPGKGATFFVYLPA